MNIVKWVKGSLGAKVSLKLAVVVLLLTTIASLVIEAHETRQLERMTLEKARSAAMLGARYYGSALDHAIDAGLITVSDAYDRNYQPIKGHDWGENPRFHTRYDVVTDAAVLVFQDQFLKDPDFLFAVGADDNGYIPTHNTVFSGTVDGVPEKDPLNNTKTKATYEVAQNAAKSLQPTLVQDYFQKRTGRWTWDVSAPIYVKGKHWGAFRVGVSKEQVQAHKTSLLLLLTLIFAIFFVATVGIIYGVVQRSMRPVVALTEAAEQISMGDALEDPIRPTTTDEVGHLTKAIDRLRVSMKAAMSRLGH